MLHSTHHSGPHSKDSERSFYTFQLSFSWFLSSLAKRQQADLTDPKTVSSLGVVKEPVNMSEEDKSIQKMVTTHCKSKLRHTAYIIIFIKYHLCLFINNCPLWPLYILLKHFTWPGTVNEKQNNDCLVMWQLFLFASKSKPAINVFLLLTRQCHNKCGWLYLYFIT